MIHEQQIGVLDGLLAFGLREFAHLDASDQAKPTCLPAYRPTARDQ